MPIVEEDLDGSSGVLFPFFDEDTNMLYMVGKVSLAWEGGGSPDPRLTGRSQDLPHSAGPWGTGQGMKRQKYLSVQM